MAGADRAGHGRRTALWCSRTTRSPNWRRRSAGLGPHEWPTRLIPSVQSFLEVSVRPSTSNLSRTILLSRSENRRGVPCYRRNAEYTVNPTVLRAGYKVMSSRRPRPRDRRPFPSGVRTGSSSTSSTGCSGRRDPRVHHHDIAVDEPPGRGPVRRDDSALLAEDPTARVVPYCRRPARMPSRSAGSACAASVSPRCGCRQTWTFPACSMASTSGFPSTGSVSEFASLTGSSTAVSTAVRAAQVRSHLRRVSRVAGTAQWRLVFSRY